MRKGGLEPPGGMITSLPPQGSASANSATPACEKKVEDLIIKQQNKRRKNFSIAKGPNSTLKSPL
jgi:hypothetical protein